MRTETCPSPSVVVDASPFNVGSLFDLGESAPQPNLAARNRINAQASTGPRSKAGKSRAAQNARKHGLTANPARGPAEDAAAFENLLKAVTAKFRPTDVIELGLIHRIALAIWRQQRAARAESALATVAFAEITHDREDVHGWIERITDHWTPVTHRAVRDDPNTGRPNPRLPPVITRSRSRLSKLDRLRTEEMAKSGTALIAMAVMLEHLAADLEYSGQGFYDHLGEQMAWLLGDQAGYLPLHEFATFRGRENLTETQRLVLAAMERPKGEPMDQELVRRIGARIVILETQAKYCEKPNCDQHQRALKTAALLPEDASLDRLIRYETHADKTLMRALDTLARLRGVTVESLSTTVTTHHQGPMGPQGATGTTLQVAASKMAVKPIQSGQ